MERNSYVSPSGVLATKVLGVPVSLVTLPAAVSIIIDWATSRKSAFICVRDVHGIMRAQDDPELMQLHQEASMVTPDGMPLAWISQRRGFAVSRVCGPDLMEEVMAASEHANVKHYLYGGKEGVPERLATSFKSKYPGIQIAGLESPSFQALDASERDEELARIRDSGASIVWVGLSTPKQEFWMRASTCALPGCVLIGVGAAFDFHTGDVRRAPNWMRTSGLEWSYRLVSEPRRLWKRYLILAPKFLWKMVWA